MNLLPRLRDDLEILDGICQNNMRIYNFLHFEMLKVYPSFPPYTEASLSRFCSGPGKQTTTHDILKEKIGSTLAKLGSGVIQRERSYHGGWEWKIIGTPFRKGFIKEQDEVFWALTVGLSIL